MGRSDGRELQIRLFEIFQEEGEDHELRWCSTFKDKGYKGVTPLSPLY
jgi:hypothetical protein